MAEQRTFDHPTAGGDRRVRSRGGRWRGRRPLRSARIHDSANLHPLHVHTCAALP